MAEEKINYLPLGSIVVVNGGVKKFMIVARAVQITIDGKPKFFDYGGCMYPEGMVGDQLMYFQHSNIHKVVFEGFSDTDNELQVENIQAAFEKMELTHADTNELKAQMEN